MSGTALRPALSRRLRRAWIGAWLVTALPGGALAFDLPRPWQAALRVGGTVSSYRMPVGHWSAEQGLPVRVVEGSVSRSVWRQDIKDPSTLALLAPLRLALEDAGFRTLFECDTDGCGGFDFRYATDVVPEPDMHVDLGDFRFCAAMRETPEGTEAVSLLVSRSASTGFVQLIRVSPLPRPEPATLAEASEPLPAATTPTETGSTAPEDGLVGRLLSDGSAVLDDLVFASGSAQLEDRPYPSLADLAGWLKSNPSRQVVVVGHTDASGSLAANEAVSRDRARAVREKLVEGLGVTPEQVAFEGVGYLAPRASNETDEGRARNRRVEVMLAASG